MGIEWSRAADIFSWDGSLRDIYVFDTNSHDWSRLLVMLKSSSWVVTYSRADENLPLPEIVETAFPAPGYADCKLAIDIGQIEVICHFYRIDQIEFDIDPREITGESRFDSLMAFMRCIADVTEKPAFLAPENASDKKLIGCWPGKCPVLLVQ